jgi:quinol-cytochrome oxidoreductase complex cytochrome b subunit
MEQFLNVRNNVILHLHPNRIPERAMRFNLTFGLGGLALVLFVLLLGSGGLMLFVYKPNPAEAYPSIQMLRQGLQAGRFVRNVHYFSANLMIIVAVLHLARVVFTSGFGGKRRSNWWIGMGALAAVATAAFSGYLLPWDQRSFWAVTICSSMLSYFPGIGDLLQSVVRGGPEVDGNTLLRFYVLHTAVLPLVMVVLLGWHFWRVRKAGGVVQLRAPDEAEDAEVERVPAIPNLVVRELAMGLGCLALVLILAAAFDAPLGPEANPELSINPAKAPWYFLGCQELLMHMHPFLAVFVIPFFGVTLFCLLPRWPGNEGVWFSSHCGRKAACLGAGTGLVLTPILVVASNSLKGSPTSSVWLNSVLLPLIVVLGMPILVLLIARFWLKADRPERIQALMAWLLAAYLALIIIGVWFRGEHMALVLPWTGAGS